MKRKADPVEGGAVTAHRDLYARCRDCFPLWVCSGAWAPLRGVKHARSTGHWVEIGRWARNERGGMFTLWRREERGRDGPAWEKAR